MLIERARHGGDNLIPSRHIRLKRFPGERKMHRFRYIFTRAAVVLVMTAMAIFAHAQDSASSGRIPAGTKLTVRTSTELTSATAEAGQTWNGTLVNEVRSGGKVIAPAGSSVSGTIVDAKSSGRLKKPGVLSLQITSVNGIAVNTDTLTRDGEGHTKSNVAKIGGGAAAGAAATGKREAKIAPETALTFTVQ